MPDHIICESLPLDNNNNLTFLERITMSTISTDFIHVTDRVLSFILAGRFKGAVGSADLKINKSALLSLKSS